MPLGNKSHWEITEVSLDGEQGSNPYIISLHKSEVRSTRAPSESYSGEQNISAITTTAFPT